MELIESIFRLLRDYLYLFCVFFFVLYIPNFTQESPIFVAAFRNDFTSLERHAIDGRLDGRLKKTSRSDQESCSAMEFGYSEGYSTYTAHNFITISVIPKVSRAVETIKLQWIGSPPHLSLIILLAEVNEGNLTNSTFFRSQENGSMVNETCKFEQGAAIDSIFVSKNPDKVIFRDSLNNHLYVTADAGNYFNHINNLSFTPDVIQFSDNYEDYLFAIDNANKSLYVSTQLSSHDSWKQLPVSTRVEAAYWTQFKDEKKFDDPTTIYFTESNQTSGNYWIKNAVYPYVNLSTCEFCQSIGEVTNFKLVYEYMFVIKNADNRSTLFVSYQRQPFVKARFIPAMSKNKQYSVVDASQGQVLLAVFNGDATADLYVSDEWGTNYSLSLRNIITNNFQWNSGIESFDFYIVKGTRGTYIANVAMTGSQKSTVISFNKGANWSPVTAPTLDSDMLPVECYYSDCLFHLDICNSGIISKESAVGMIMARGTLDRGFVKSAGLYLSYDGGFSWRELFKTNETNSTYLFDILDSGSTIFVVNKTNDTRKFMLSHDTGYSWQQYVTNATYSPGLCTEMNDTASFAALYGYLEFPYSRYVVLNFNTSQLNINECKDDDYITWMPSDGRIRDRCVLGKKFTYRKRKLGHCCRNQPNYWKLLDSEKCKCTIEDFGCDVGFERIDYNSPCTPVDDYPFDCTLSNYSLYGYRQIPGDECIPQGHGYLNKKLEQPCPNRIENGATICASISGPEFAEVNDTIEFDLNVNLPISSDTIYNWIIINLNDESLLRNSTSSETTIYINFNRTSIYKIIVQGLSLPSQVEIFNATKTISIKGKTVIHASISGPEFALINNTVKFVVNIYPLFNKPSDIIYRWIIINHNDEIVFAKTIKETTLCVVFNISGAYEVIVQGLNPQSHIVINATSAITIGGVFFCLMATPSVVTLNQLVTLSVIEGVYMENYVYLFSFGDNQSSVQTSNNSVVHFYSVSGIYQASVAMQSFDTSVYLETVVVIQDTIGKICVNTYAKSLAVTYIAIIDCEAPSNKTYGIIQYTWDFGNGKNITTSQNAIATTYQSTGTYNFSVFASNNVSQKRCTGQIYVDAESDTTNVQTNITGPRFALVNITVMFSVSNNALHNLTHNWTIIDQNASQVYCSKEDNKLAINFTKPGTYKVLVSINYDGSMYILSHITTVESKIYYIKVYFPPVIEVARQTAIFIHLYNIHNDSYKEFVNINIISDTQSNMLQYVKSPITVKTYLSYSVNDIYKVYVTAKNHLSEASTSFSVEVVRTSTTLLLEFSVVSLSQANVSYESTSWRKQFSDVIDASLTNESNLPDWKLFVTAGYVNDFLEMFVDVLPTLTALSNATMIAEQLVDVLNSNYTFSLPNSNLSISVSNAIILGLPQEPSECPTKEIPSKTDRNDNNSLELGIGIGMPVLITLVLAIVIGIIFYKRKFYQSRKQYRRLREPSQPSYFINDEADSGLDRTNDIPMDEIVPDPMTNYENETANI